MSADLVNPADFDLVVARWLRDTERIAPDRLLLTFDPAAAPALLELAERIPAGIAVGLQDGQLLAEITVPPQHDDLLDGIVLRAETAELRALQHHIATDGPPVYFSAA